MKPQTLLRTFLLFLLLTAFRKHPLCSCTSSFSIRLRRWSFFGVFFETLLTQHGRFLQVEEEKRRRAHDTRNKHAHRGQRTEDRGQRTECRAQNAERRTQNAERRRQSERNTPPTLFVLFTDLTHNKPGVNATQHNNVDDSARLLAHC